MPWLGGLHLPAMLIRPLVRSFRRLGMAVELEQVGVRCTIMRGGTSKGIFILDEDLPREEAARERILLRMFGSPGRRCLAIH